MKSFIVLMAIFVLFSLFSVFQQDSNIYQFYLYKFSKVAEEMAVSSSQYIILDEYIEGNIVFDTNEGHKAAKEILKSGLNIDESLNPKNNRFLNQKIEYELFFFDNSNTNFPHIFNYENKGFQVEIREPSVIAVINGGSFNFRSKFINNNHHVFGMAVFEWKGY